MSIMNEHAHKLIGSWWFDGELAITAIIMVDRYCLTSCGQQQVTH